MGSVSIDNSSSEIPGGNEAISGATGEQAGGPVEAAYSSIMSLKVINSLFFINIIYFDLSITITEGDFIIITKWYGADIIIDLIGLVESVDISGTSRPNVERSIQSNSDLIFIWPV